MLGAHLWDMLQLIRWGDVAAKRSLQNCQICIDVCVPAYRIRHILMIMRCSV